MTIKEELKGEYDKYVEINKDDPYSHAVVAAGEVFGKLVDEGSSFEEAEKLMLKSSEGSGLTGYMMGALMSALVHFHPQGKEINIWWNKKFDVGKEEKGTVNPAIINVN